MKPKAPLQTTLATKPKPLYRFDTGPEYDDRVYFPVALLLTFPPDYKEEKRTPDWLELAYHCLSKGEIDGLLEFVKEMDLENILILLLQYIQGHKVEGYTILRGPERFGIEIRLFKVTDATKSTEVTPLGAEIG